MLFTQHAISLLCSDDLGGGGGPEGLDPLPPPKYMYQTKEFV